MIELTVEDRDGSESVIAFSPVRLIIAGWTGRDAAALEAHIVELEELGIARPKSVPIFYRVAASLLTQSATVEMVGVEASGEVEAVLWKHDGALYVGVGSDHTDRKLEAVGITLSKQLCAKPVSPRVWRWSDVADHWDQMVLRSTLPDTNETYQEGGAASLRRPDELLALYESQEGIVPDGTVMYCGTFAVHGGIRFAPAIHLELIDPVAGRSIGHGYAVDVLPIAES
ncbi:MAG: DUF2848 domain-containing protein [Sphingobium sp.]